VIASDVKAVNGYKMAKVAKEWAGLLDSMFKRGNTFMRDSDRKSVSQSA
jgi:hypothetical protein